MVHLGERSIVRMKYDSVSRTTTCLPRVQGRRAMVLCRKGETYWWQQYRYKSSVVLDADGSRCCAGVTYGLSVVSVTCMWTSRVIPVPHLHYRMLVAYSKRCCRVYASRNLQTKYAKRLSKWVCMLMAWLARWRFRNALKLLSFCSQRIYFSGQSTCNGV